MRIWYSTFPTYLSHFAFFNLYKKDGTCVNRESLTCSSQSKYWTFAFHSFDFQSTSTVSKWTQNCELEASKLNLWISLSQLSAFEFEIIKVIKTKRFGRIRFDCEFLEYIFQIKSLQNELEIVDLQFTPILPFISNFQLLNSIFNLHHSLTIFSLSQLCHRLSDNVNQLSKNQIFDL